MACFSKPEWNAKNVKIPRRCRVSQARMRTLVQRALASWNYIFGYDVSFSSDSTTCVALNRDVKGLLASCPSDVWTEVMSFQSIKKLLPDSCPCLENDMINKVADKLSSPPRKLPAGYMRFVSTQARKFFSKGWDRSYPNHCLTTTPPIKSCIESRCSTGGSMGLDGDQVDFLNAVQGLCPVETDGVEAELLVVQSAGKPRPLSKFSAEQLVVRPVHKALYDRLSLAPWLCRGDVTDDKLRKAGFMKGNGVLTSGDYQSATDNLSIEVAEEILRCAFENSVHIPPDVQKRCMSTLRPTLYKLKPDLSPCARLCPEDPNNREYQFVASNGQMMGSYLSFPLLCFQNFLGVTWARRSAGLGRLPLLINGDDILFQSSRSFASHWMAVVSELGLEVEKTKTSIDDNWGTLNSTLISWSGRRLSVVPTLRFGMLKHTDIPHSLGQNFQKFALDQKDPEIRWRAAKEYFRWHLPTMRSIRATPDEYGFRGTLAYRMSKIFSLRFPDDDVLPLPLAPSPHNVRIPPDSVVAVDFGSVGEELERVNSFMMASWKWAHRFERTSSALRYCLAISSIRRPAPPDLTFHTRLPLTELTNSEIRRRFKRAAEARTQLIFRDLLTTQSIDEFEPLPPYEAVEYSMVLEHNPKTCTK